MISLIELLILQIGGPHLLTHCSCYFHVVYKYMCETNIILFLHLYDCFIDVCYVDFEIKFISNKKYILISINTGFLHLSTETGKLIGTCRIRLLTVININL